MSANLQQEIDAFGQTSGKPVFPLDLFPQRVAESIGFHFPKQLPILEIRDGLDCPLTRNQLLIKRSVDLFLVAIAFGIFIVPMIVIATLIKMGSKGPIFYGQERVGLGGKTFKMWKFRSMRVGAEEDTGAVWAIRNDPRKTRFGTFLRATSLDELPQMWNVFKGEMSMIGPRPERPHFVNEFRKKIPGYMDRHRIPVGITGWAQINGWRGNTSLERRVEYDLSYIKKWSPLLDLKILVLTLFRGFIHPNAY